MKSITSPIARLFFGVLIGVCSQLSHGQVALTVEAAGGASDNITRVSSNEDAAGIASIGLQFDINEQSRRMDTTARGSVYYIDYINTDAYDNDTLAALDGTVTFTVKENMLTWLVQDNFGQQVINPFQAVTPNNRENINFFTTGPDFQFQVADRTAILVGARYSDVAYETSPLDNQRVGGSLGFLRSMSSARTLSINVAADKIDYDQPSNTDFDRNLAYLRFSTKAARSSIDMDVGWNQVKTDQDTGDGFYLALSGSRQISSQTNLTGSLGSRYSDAGDIFRFMQGIDQNPGDTQNVQGVGSPFQNNYGTLGLNVAKSRTTFAARLLYSDEDYETQDVSDRTVLGMSVSAIRQLRSSLDASLGVDLYSYKYDVGGRKDEDLRLFGELSWKFSRTLQARIRYDRFDRSSNANGDDYTENRLFLILAYTPEF